MRKGDEHGLDMATMTEITWLSAGYHLYLLNCEPWTVMNADKKSFLEKNLKIKNGYRLEINN